MNIPPLTFQALFHIYFDLIMYMISYKLYKGYKKEGNQIAKNLSLAFLMAGIEYSVLVISISFFPEDLLLARLSGTVAWIFAYAATLFGFQALGNLYPKLPIKLITIIVSIIGIIMTYIYTFPFLPAQLNKAGMINFDHPPIVIMIGSILFFAAFGSVGLTLIYKTFKERLFLKGLLIGIGMAEFILFLPLTYQVESYAANIFFSLLAGLGITMVLFGMNLKTRRRL